MNYRLQEMKVGLMVILAFALFLFFVFVISGIQFKKETVLYTTHLRYVGGLEVGTPVRLGGVMAGRIADIVFPEEKDQQIKLVLELEAKTPVKTDSRAYMTSIGLLGEFYVEIDPGSPDAQILPPGSEIPSLTTSSFSQLSTTMGNMAASAETTIVRINRILGPRNQLYFSGILENINEIMASNARHLNQMLNNMEFLSTELVRITSRLDTLLQDNDLVIQKTMRHLDSTLVESKNLLQQTQKSLASLDEIVISNSGRYQAIMNSLARSTQNLEEFSRSIRARPWNLVRKSQPKPRTFPDKQEKQE